MRTDGDGSQVQDLFVQDKIISQEVNKDVQRRVAAAAGGIAVHLQRHYFFKKGIKKINEAQQKSSYLVVHCSHAGREGKTQF